MSTGSTRRLIHRLAPVNRDTAVKLRSFQVITVNGDGTLDVYMGADKVTPIPGVSKIDLGAAVTLAPGDQVWGLYVDGGILILGREDT